MAGELIKMEHICKEFPGVKALDDVTFELKAGEVHALVGENGAGKSTLMKVLTGVYTKDSGRILLNGEEISINNVRDAQRKGIIMIHQELNLMNHLTAAQNIFIGREYKTKAKVFLDAKTQNQEAKKLFERLNQDIDPTVKVGDLPVAKQQMVEIAKALSYDSKILIMDEPTAALTDNEIEDLFRVIRMLREEGRAIIHISHRLEEIMEIGDHVTILRDGKYVADADVKDIDVPWIVHQMTGGAKSYPKRDREVDWSKVENVLEVKDLCLPKAGGGYLVDHLNFELKKGEVLGIYGLMGAGRSEVFECLMGLHPEHTGQILMEGKELHIKSISQQIDSGFALIPEDRQMQGLVQTLDIEKNCALSALKRYKKGPFLDSKKEAEKVDQEIKDIQIKVADKKLPILSLSGGNQQKVVIGKGILTEPKILLMDEPSRGIDIGAKTEVFDIINKYAEEGLSIIVISSELQEIVSIADRVIVLSNGIKTGEFFGDEIQQDTLVLASYKGHHIEEKES